MVRDVQLAADGQQTIVQLRRKVFFAAAVVISTRRSTYLTDATRSDPSAGGLRRVKQGD
jgi:hypothetical protein